jgi:GT2 family glycosyltransferase
MLNSIHQINTYKNFDIVVVDHGSTDHSEVVLSRWAAVMPIRVIKRDGNYSFSESNNLAAASAEGDYVLFMNNDIELAQDCLAMMANILEDITIGIVGIKMVERNKASIGGLNIVHIGVRFRWDLDNRWLRPYNVKPRISDKLLSMSCASFPAVTAAMMMCKAADFRDIDGFDEEYNYGLEDVALCCKMRVRLGKEIVSLNSTHVIHHRSSTRKQIPAEELELQRKQNQMVLRLKWGYALRRDHRRRLVGDDGSYSGEAFVIGIIQYGHHHVPIALSKIMEAVKTQLGWRVRIVDPFDLDALAQVHVCIICDQELLSVGLLPVRPDAIMILWAGKEEDTTQFRGKVDAVLSADEPSGRGMAATVSPPGGWDGSKEPTSSSQDHVAWFKDVLIHAATVQRISIRPQRTRYFRSLARELAMALVRPGRLVKIDVDDHDGARALADDVCIWLGQYDVENLLPEQINIWWTGRKELNSAKGARFDHVILHDSLTGYRFWSATADAKRFSELNRSIDELHYIRLSAS